MTPDLRAKDFARFILKHTTEVETIGTCRRYKGKVLNIDELYDAWEEFKAEHRKKY